MTPKEQDELQLKLATPFARKLKAEINRYINTISLLFDRNTAVIENDYYLAEHAINIKKIWEYYARKAIEQFGSGVKIQDNQRQLDWWHIRAIPEGYKSFFDYLFSQWVIQQGGQEIKNIAETTRNDIKKIIQLETLNEFSTQEIAKKILKVKALSSFRAKTIAITEVGTAGSFANFETAKKISVDNNIIVKKKWIPVQDERTRINHASMASYPAIPMEQDFIVGGVKMNRPKDPRGGASNVIRCRCAMIFIRE